jgi:hypothetical protein
MNKLEELKGSDMLLVSAKKVNGGKYQLCFAQKIDNPESRPASISGLLNASDERFTQSGKPRYAWISGEAADIKAQLGVDVSSLQNVGDEMEIGQLNPSIKDKKLNIQITETTEGSEYDVANFATRAKRAGKDGDFILTADGEYIYVKATVVAHEPKHVFFSDTTRGSQAAGAAESAVSDLID